MTTTGQGGSEGDLPQEAPQRHSDVTGLIIALRDARQLDERAAQALSYFTTTGQARLRYDAGLEYAEIWYRGAWRHPSEFVAMVGETRGGDSDPRRR